MAEAKSKKAMYSTKNRGEFDDSFELMGKKYVKVEDLRYGTNPHQPAAFYRPEGSTNLVLGGMKILKTGKSGLSQTNYEDMHHALGIVNYYDRPACAVMKHVNPSGAAVQTGSDTMKDVYIRARDCDPQAAFGSVVAFNKPVDQDTAAEIMSTIVEGVVAPGYEDGVLEMFSDFDRFKKNKQIRIILVENLDKLPKYVGDDTGGFKEIKVFGDGSLLMADPYLTKIHNTGDLELGALDDPKKGSIKIEKEPSAQELEDLMFSWYVNIHVRSNGVIICKNGQTVCVGTGQQDRVGAVQMALDKYKDKYKGTEDIKGAVLASDGFFPFRDSIDLMAKVGITAVVQPGGSVADYEVIKACNEHGISMVFTGERCFSHH